MKRIILVVASVALMTLMEASAHAQSINITASQHVFTNVTATPTACDNPGGCWTVTGKIAQPEICSHSAFVSLVVSKESVGSTQASARVVSPPAAVFGNATDCSFVIGTAPTFESSGFEDQDGFSSGLLVVHWQDDDGLSLSPFRIAWDSCSGGPCPTSSLTNVPPQIANAYITNAGSNTVSVLNTSSNSVTATIPVGPNPVSVAVSPSGSRAYVTNAGSNSVSVIDTSALTVIQNVTVGGNPVSVAITPDGSQVYVANARSNSVSVINTSTNTVSATIPVGFIPLKVAVTPDGTSVYVANSAAKSLSVISTATNSVVATVPVGLLPENMAIQ